MPKSEADGTILIFCIEQAWSPGQSKDSPVTFFSETLSITEMLAAIAARQDDYNEKQEANPDPGKWKRILYQVTGIYDLPGTLDANTTDALHFFRLR